MGAIDESKLNNILPKYDELKLSGKNLAQQYVSAFNTGMNIYQCINQLQGYIEWVIKAVNDVVVQWNEIVDKQIKYAIDKSVEASVEESVKTSINASKQATTEQFNVEWEKVQSVLEQFNVELEKVQSVLKTLENNVKLVKVNTNYYVLTENEDKTIKKLDYYFKYNQHYTKGAPYYNTGLTIRGLDLGGYTLKTFMLKNNIFKVTDSNGDLIDYVYMNLDSVTVTDNIVGDVQFTDIDVKFIPAVTKFTGKEESNGNLDLNTCITLILEKTSS